MKKILATILALTAILSLSACGGKKGDDSSADSSKSLDLRTLSVDEIIEGAKAEGRVESVGMPDDWTHWDFSYKALLDQYGLEHADVDLSSAEEIAMFVAEKDDPTKDIGEMCIRDRATASPPPLWKRTASSPTPFPAGTPFLTGPRILTASGPAPTPAIPA